MAKFGNPIVAKMGLWEIRGKERGERERDKR